MVPKGYLRSFPGNGQAEVRVAGLITGRKYVFQAGRCAVTPRLSL